MATVQVAILGGVTRLSGAPTLVANGRGYFAEQGIDIEYVGAHGDHAMEMINEGQIPVAAMRPSLYFYRGWNEQQPAALAADGGRLLPGKGGGAIVARPQLVAEGTLRDYPDLRGLRIGLSPDQGDHDWLTLATALRKAGLDWSEVNVIECDYGDGRHQALTEGSIDVTTVSNAKSVIQGQESGTFVPWKYENDVEEGRQASAVIFSQGFRSDRKLAEAYLVAYLKGARDYYRAFHEERDRELAIEAMASESGLSPDIVAHDIVPLAIDPDGQLNMDSLNDDLNWMHDAGVIGKSVTIDKVVDYSHLDAALEQLGRYARGV